MKILILGANGFIGTNLVQRILGTTDWTVDALDIKNSNLKGLLENPRLNFVLGRVEDHADWIENCVRQCDIVFPLAAIVNPKACGEIPLRVFELNFEANLQIVRWAAEYGKRLIFPSTSEVYGLCDDDAFTEDSSNMVYGPIHRVRWIYACTKQLLDRIIYSYGQSRQLEYTIFRPFNWIGPYQDTLEAARSGHSRVLIQFIANFIDGKATQLVNGGSQQRCFTDIDDAIDALMQIIEQREQSRNQIFNIGNPDNVYRIKDFERIARKIFAEVSGAPLHTMPVCTTISQTAYYGKGKGFQDITHRVPDISHITERLHWEPTRSIEESVRKTVAHLLQVKRAA